MTNQQVINIQSESLKDLLQQTIDTNSRFIPHIKDNLIKINEGEVYYLGQQGWSDNLANHQKKINFHQNKNSETFSEERIYRDWVENIKGNQNSNLTPEIINKIRDEKLFLQGIRFSKRFDNIFIEQICRETNFNPKAISKNKQINLRDVLTWIIENISKLINTTNPDYSKENQGHGNLVIDVKDLILLINQPLADEIKVKEIFGEIKLANYLKDLTIIDASLPNNFEAILISKKGLWYTYQITKIEQITEEGYQFFNRLCLWITYELGLVPFASSCAYLKSAN